MSKIRCTCVYANVPLQLAWLAERLLALLALVGRRPVSQWHVGGRPCRVVDQHVFDQVAVSLERLPARLYEYNSRIQPPFPNGSILNLQSSAVRCRTLETDLMVYITVLHRRSLVVSVMQYDLFAQCRCLLCPANKGAATMRPCFNHATQDLKSLQALSETVHDSTDNFWEFQLRLANLLDVAYTGSQVD